MSVFCLTNLNCQKRNNVTDKSTPVELVPVELFPCILRHTLTHTYDFTYTHYNTTYLR